MKLRYFLFMSLFPVLCQGQIVKNFEQKTDQVNVVLPEGTLSIHPIADNAVRIQIL